MAEARSDKSAGCVCYRRLGISDLDASSFQGLGPVRHLGWAQVLVVVASRGYGGVGQWRPHLETLLFFQVLAC